MATTHGGEKSIDKHLLLLTIPPHSGHGLKKY